MSYDWRENRKNHIEDHRRHNNDYRHRHPERRKTQQRTYLIENNKEINIRRRKRYPHLATQLKIEVLGHYSVEQQPNCLHCGEDDIDVLCIDHINDNGAEERRQHKAFYGQTFYHWLRKNDYPPGYQVLCCNCNQKKEVLRRREGRRL